MATQPEFLTQSTLEHPNMPASEHLNMPSSLQPVIPVLTINSFRTAVLSGPERDPQSSPVTAPLLEPSQKATAALPAKKAISDFKAERITSDFPAKWGTFDFPAKRVTVDFPATRATSNSLAQEAEKAASESLAEKATKPEFLDGMRTKPEPSARRALQSLLLLSALRSALQCPHL
ncbi:hypothetical protein Q8A67_016866 [Cirrhinus molitorella]|uniref:Uncharacterized protein n=1 Tax=Cirrhinus molitorella TaxID=172907 RepID=A0AA88PGR4_9TELE|nr:hypothetical protein Q8A67_016866 [Cirrhinus molitorella]